MAKATPCDGVCINRCDSQIHTIGSFSRRVMQETSNKEANTKKKRYKKRDLEILMWSGGLLASDNCTIDQIGVAVSCS